MRTHGAFSALAMLTVAAAAFGVAATASGQVPEKMNYQVMLTDELGSPLVEQPVTLFFEIYDDPEFGDLKWSETHVETTNTIGVVSVVLGSIGSIHSPDFNQSLWLQISVDGAVLEPRRELVSAPYAFYAADSDALGGLESDDYVTDLDLSVPGSFNDPSNPVDWTRLKSVPEDIADGDDVGTGVSGEGGVGRIPRFIGATTIGESALYEVDGQIMLGTVEPEGKFTIVDVEGRASLAIANASPEHGFEMVEIERREDMSWDDVVVMLRAPVSSTGGNFLECGRQSVAGGYSPFSVDLDGGVHSIGGMEVSDTDTATIYAYSFHGSNATRVVQGIYAPGGGDPYDAAGIYGKSVPQDYHGFGGEFEGGYVGAMGYVFPTGGDLYYGLSGHCDGGTGINTGVRGSAVGSNVNYGVYGTAGGGVENWAGYFLGSVYASVDFVSPTATLQIDHPLDPADQYLRHACVTSSEMKTVYDGTVVLDSAGEASVELPEWFEALNGDFRYQLTPIGEPAPRLHVSRPISGNSFAIAGGEPSMTVSWQVTGIRHDGAARQRPLVVEEDKRPVDRGRYVTPAAFGAPQEMGIGHVEMKESVRD
jgi:hypothetical protein